MNLSSATQAVEEGQLIKKYHNANLARNCQSISFPEPCTADKYIKLRKRLLHVSYRYFKNEKPVIIHHIAIFS